MTSEDAQQAARSVSRVLLHSYPHTDDITDDPERIASLLLGVEQSPELEGHSARVYRSGPERILVVEHRH